MTSTPVALIVFNRPDLTARVFARIRAARPPVLLLAADGPRAHVPGDEELCKAARAEVAHVDWPCEVHRDFSDANLGQWTRCGTALDRVFAEAERAIFFEDDCLPDPSFFPFCDELLERYEDDPRVLAISGTTVGGRWHPERASYHFARRAANWGWAAWRRTWLGHEQHSRGWSDPRVRRRVRRALGNGHYRPWARWMDAAYHYRADYGVALLFSMLERDGVSVVPSANLVTNLGFRPDATTNFNARPGVSNIPAVPMPFPLRHPRDVAPDAGYDRRVREIRHPAPRLRWPWWADEISRERTMRKRARA